MPPRIRPHRSSSSPLDRLNSGYSLDVQSASDALLRAEEDRLREMAIRQQEMSTERSELDLMRAKAENPVHIARADKEAASMAVYDATVEDAISFASELDETDDGFIDGFTEALGKYDPAVIKDPRVANILDVKKRGFDRAVTKRDEIIQSQRGVNDSIIKMAGSAFGPAATIPLYNAISENGGDPIEAGRAISSQVTQMIGQSLEDRGYKGFAADLELIPEADRLVVAAGFLTTANERARLDQSSADYKRKEAEIRLKENAQAKEVYGTVSRNLNANLKAMMEQRDALLKETNGNRDQNSDIGAALRNYETDIATLRDKIDEVAVSLTNLSKPPATAETKEDKEAIIKDASKGNR